MKMQSYFFLLLFISTITSYAQTTAIPDPNFEYALIDLGIDSDGTVNGQVLTADIADITSLDFSGYYLSDLTGIEDFSVLKVLNISDTGLSNGNYPRLLDLSQVHSLEELYINSDLDNLTVLVDYLDLSNNPNLKKIKINDNWSIKRIYLQGSDLDISDLLIDLTGSGACIQVTNANDAQNGQGVYATWNLVCAGCSLFSEDCSLSTEDFVKNNFQLYPNPVTEMFTINSQQNIETINIYNLQGKLVKSYAQPQENYSVVELAKGIYLVEIQTFANQKEILKLIKK